ncbi:hypothetical protein ACJX0J_025309, partial [Zea mays]
GYFLGIQIIDIAFNNFYGYNETYMNMRLFISILYQYFSKKIDPWGDFVHTKNGKIETDGDRFYNLLIQTKASKFGDISRTDHALNVENIIFGPENHLLLSHDQYLQLQSSTLSMDMQIHIVL